jgi:hypothetical protein
VVVAGSAAYVVTRGNAAGKPVVDAKATTGSDGGFAFSVSGVRCGVTTVGPEGLTTRAKGQFCLVNVAVRNGAKDAVLLDPGAQQAIDATGHRYGVAEEAAVFLNDGTPTLMEGIPAGATVAGVLPFDVPAGTRLADVELHESVASGGVRVQLS